MKDVKLKMKWLRKLRLINWHYFSDETMHFGSQTIVTGMTGAGKSTIIDALQVLLVANRQQIRFNAAAHEDARRSLISYLRGKIGSQDRAYRREKEFTSYIIAEFRDDKQRENFVVGVVLDVHRDNEIHDEYFIIDKCKLEDLTMKSVSGNWCTRDEFKRLHKTKNAQFERTKSSYQAALLNRFGQLEPRFFSVLCRALSFKPIDDIRDFVYSFILDKKELQLDLLKQNFELHEKYQLDLRDLQERRTYLSKICEKYDTYSQLSDLVKQQQYVILSLQLASRRAIVENNNSSIQKAKTDLDGTLALVNKAIDDRATAAQRHMETWHAYQSHGTRQVQERLEESLREQHASLATHRQKLHAVIGVLNRVHSLVTELNTFPSSLAWQWEARDNETLSTIAELLTSLPHHVRHDSTQSLRAAGDYLSALQNRMVGEGALVKRRVDELDSNAQRLHTEIDNLRNKRRPYQEQLLNLKSVLTERLGSRSQVWVLCEELEIRDEEWRNAIEGYLNTQRFDLLVEPQVFREALAVYEHEKSTHNFDGVGLVDTENEQRYLGSIKTGSLAELLDTQNPIALARIHHVLGRVMCASDTHNLRSHDHAVTKTCMSYSNLVARQIPRQRFEIPYIGSQAIVRQLEIKVRDLSRVEDELSALRNAWICLGKISDKLVDKKAQLETIAEQLDLPSVIIGLEASVNDLTDKLKTLDTTELESLQTEVEYWKNQKTELEIKVGQLNERRFSLDSSITTLTRERQQTELHHRQSAQDLEKWLAEHTQETAARAKERLVEAQKSTNIIESRIANWESNQKANVTLRDKEFVNLRELRQGYNLHYSFNSDHTAEDNSAYQQILAKIGDFDIPTYQAKLGEALRQSEDQFKSHFLHKMREAIREARNEFDRINNALRNFPFSDDRYHFEVRASEKYKQFYDCILDDTLSDRDSLFALPDDERATTLHNLFDQLIHGEADAHAEFTDYRRYLDFDISVTSQNSRYSFSKVLREKSGGETQTPFYIIILAAFNQLYATGKTIRLVIFDEAFNKMDEQRIKTSLRLIKQLNLQLIAAVPDEKLQHMAPEVTTTLLVSRENYDCFVDMIAQEEVAAGHDDIREQVQDPNTLFPLT